MLKIRMNKYSSVLHIVIETLAKVVAIFSAEELYIL